MNPPNYPAAMAQVLQIAVAARTAELARYVSIETKNTVQYGPFAGMILPEEVSWGNGDITSKLLGTYECELHPAIERAIARNPEVVFNVGCAEGYYAVGLARRLPKANVFAYDKDEKARLACMSGCGLNRTPISYVGHSFSGRDALTLANRKNSLMVMDIEGGELQVLSLSGVDYLKHCDVIVECHDFMEATTTAQLIGRLGNTHNIEVIYEGPRDPSSIPLLQNMCSLDRWLALSENRPARMNWLVCWVRERV